MNKLTRKDIENTLNYFKPISPELKSLTLFDADERCGKRIALAEIREDGTVDVKTEFMTYTGMNQYLYGYNAKSQELFKA